MLVHIKLLIRKGNRTFWYNRLVMFNGTSDRYGDTHFNKLIEITTRIGKKKRRVRRFTKPTPEILGRITHAVKEGFFLGTEDYIGMSSSIEEKIEKRLKIIKNNIKRGCDNPLMDANPNVPIPKFT